MSKTLTYFLAVLYCLGNWSFR